MSQWASISGTFNGTELSKEGLSHLAPRGSEGGLEIHIDDDRKRAYFDGRLRDFSDLDSPTALAWFLHHADMYGYSGTLTIDIDSGPRYRYEWTGSQLIKLRGVLD